VSVPLEERRILRSVQQELGELLRVLGEVKALAGSVVEFVRDGVEFGFGDRAEVGALGEVLPQQAVGVLVGAALPGSVRVAEVDLDGGVDADLLPARISGPLVPSQRAAQRVRSVCTFLASAGATCSGL